MPNYLESWAQVTELMAQRRQREDDEAVAEMQRRYPAQVEKMLKMSGRELLDHLLAFSKRDGADPRRTKIYQDLVEVAKAELLRRLGESGD